MKISPTWLALMLLFSFTGVSLHAQDAEETPEENTAEEASEETEDEQESDGDVEENNAANDEGKPEDSEAASEEEEPAEEPEKTWEDRLIPSVAVSGLEPAPEVIVGEPSASTAATPGKKIYFPYAPRPHSPLPPGWVLRPSADLPPITRNVTLADGRRVILEFPAMELVPAPADDGSMAMQEPGFDPRKVSRENTVSETLNHFIEDSKKHRETLGETLREMEQILLSAPAAPRPSPRNNDEPSSPLLPPSSPR